MSCFAAHKLSDGVDRRKDLPIEEHELTVDEVLQKHSVSLQTGLTAAQVAERRAVHGWNRLKPADVIPPWLLYIYQYTNFFSILLMVGGVLCLIAYGLDTSDPSNLYLGIVLEVVVFLSSTFSYFQEAKSNAIMQGFKNMVPKKCKVLQDGAWAILEAVELVPGDVVEYQEGDQVPADLRVTQAYNLKVDNSSLTGESEAQERTADVVGAAAGGHETHGHAAGAAGGHASKPGKRTPAIEASNLMFFSTIVVSGHGQGVVVGTGDNTVMGQIAGLTGEASPEDATPPLIQEINFFIKWVSIIAICLGLVFLGVGIALEVHSVVQALVYCISVIVATVPEGLLVTLTVALALTAKRMHSRSVLVKNLQGVETLGCTTIIASDKTGTLTQNRMTVQHCWCDDELHDVPAPRNLPEYQAMMADRSQKGLHGWLKYDPDNPTFRMVAKIATICNNSEFVLANNSLDPAAGLLDLSEELKTSSFNLLDLQCTGDASESGLVKMVQMLRDAKEYRSKNPKLFEIKFNSTNKWQLGVYTDTEAPAGTPPQLLIKGAPEKVWARCTHILHQGQVQPITQEWTQRFNAAYERLGSLGERVLGFAYRYLEGIPHDFAFSEQPEPNFPTDSLTFAGLMSLMDPPRLGVPEAVTKCKQASVRVFMVTGDHPITAKAIAHEIGILDEEQLKAGKASVFTGDDIRAIMDLPTEEAQIAAWDRVLAHQQLVFARVTPAHKLLIVEHNQRHGHMVAVTGDGVNDAPALKRANIGISMGIAGKDVSKEAADMILMDDNFASIVNGVEEGRLVFDNLKKSIMYAMTAKPPELIPFIIWVAAGFPLALSTILILAIDLGTDILPAIGLAYETKETAIMLRPPRSVHTDKLVDGSLLLYTYLHFGIIQALAGFFAFIMALNDWGYPPNVLMGLGLSWSEYPLLCKDTDGDGKADSCGFACGAPKEQPATIASLQASYSSAGISDAAYCTHGCFMPNNSTWDPFVEFTPTGFRGFAAGVEAVCGRTCAWWQGLSPDTKATYLQAAATGGELSLILTPRDEQLFSLYCSPNNTQSALYGFPDRGRADGHDHTQAEWGASYWWSASSQAVPGVHWQKAVLQEAQTSYFVTVVLCKVVTVLVSKTRRLSIFQHGIKNNKFVLAAIVCMVCVAVALSYIPPLNVVFSTQPLYGLHWCMAFPFMTFIFVYDEVRKLIIRRAGGFVERVLYW